MRYAIIGDKNFTDYKVIATILRDAFSPPGKPASLIISGPHAGVEALASVYADNHDVPTHICTETSYKSQMRELIRDADVLVVISNRLTIFKDIKEYALSKSCMVIEFPIDEYRDYYDL